MQHQYSVLCSGQKDIQSIEKQLHLLQMVLEYYILFWCSYFQKIMENLKNIKKRNRHRIQSLEENA